MAFDLGRFALISDIHANVEALDAVLEDIRLRGINTILCLGDVVGYGPDPKACIDKVRETCSLTLRGNHDEAILFEPYFFNSFALRAIHWTRDLLLDTKDPHNVERIAWLDGLVSTYEQGRYLFVHGSPRDPVNEYVTETDVLCNDTEKFDEIFAAVPHVCFIGHTHVPSIITERLDYLPPHQFGDSYKIGDQKLIVNVGSVGQPRDGNTKSSYVEVDGDMIHFHRVRYKYTTTMLKIKQTDELHPVLGDRLMSGV